MVMLGCVPIDDQGEFSRYCMKQTGDDLNGGIFHVLAQLRIRTNVLGAVSSIINSITGAADNLQLYENESRIESAPITLEECQKQRRSLANFGACHLNIHPCRVQTD